jgi:hypothetical protein
MSEAGVVPLSTRNAVRVTLRDALALLHDFAAIRAP